MENQKLSFEDFIADVDAPLRAFVTELHQSFLECGCKIEVKSAKKGLLVCYLFHGKTVANYVFRNKGLLVRIYANHLRQYMELLDTLPDGMTETIIGAPICKRLVNPNACNSKCTMGYDFFLKGEHLQKCRSNAFLFLLCDENNAFIKAFLEKELEACTQACVNA